MTLAEAIEHASKTLAAHHIEDSRLESELLLRHALGLSRTELYLNLPDKLNLEQVDAFERLIRCRLCGEPTAYITGHREFYGLDFQVNASVLIPRPESELLVEEAIRLVREEKLASIADIGTGSGAIAVSLSANLPQVRIYATDISEKALGVAQINAAKHNVTENITFLQGDLLKPLPQPADLVIANLPYVKQTDLPLNGFEPLLALDGGADGLKEIRRLCLQLKDRTQPRYLLLEIGLGQSNVLVSFLRDLFPSSRIEVIPDLASIDRVIRVEF